MQHRDSVHRPQPPELEPARSVRRPIVGTRLLGPLLLGTLLLGTLLLGTLAAPAIAQDAGPPPQIDADLLAAAEAARKGKDWSEAARLYELALGATPPPEADDPQRLDALETLADLYLFRLQRSRRAMPHYEEAVTIRRRIEATSGSRAAKTWGYLGGLYHDLRAYPKAIVLAREDLQREEAELGSDSPDLVRYLVDLGWLLRQAEPENPQIDELLLRANDLAAEGDPEDQEKVATELARHYQQLGELQLAATYFSDALDAHLRVATPSLDRQADLLRDLAEVQVDLGQPEAAVRSLRDALALDESHLGSHHPQLPWTLRQLGLALTTLGHHDEASRTFERAIEITAVVRGPAAATSFAEGIVALTTPRTDSGHTAETEPAHAVCCDPGEEPLEAEIRALKSAGEVETAIERVRFELAARERRDGPHAESVLDALDHLGTLLWSVDALGSIEAHERQFAILERDPKADDRKLGHVAGSLGYLHSTVKQFADSETWYVERIERYGKASPDTERLADAVEDLAWVRVKLEKYDEAVLDYELSLELWRQALGEDAPRLREKKRYLANTLAKSERFEEAEEILLAQLDELEGEELSRESWLDLERTYGSLNRLYKAAGRQREALRAEELRSALYDER